MERIENELPVWDAAERAPLLSADTQRAGLRLWGHRHPLGGDRPPHRSTARSAPRSAPIPPARLAEAAERLRTALGTPRRILRGPFRGGTCPTASDSISRHASICRRENGARASSKGETDLQQGAHLRYCLSRHQHERDASATPSTGTDCSSPISAR